VLVAGGFNRNTGSAVSTAELYDPGTGTWTAVGSLAQARVNQTATLLPNGKVLVSGGAPDNLQFTSLSSVEVYDPDAGIWTTDNPMSSARQAHTSTLLPDGRVLVAGGFSVGYFTSSAEIYDLATRTWYATGTLGTSRGVHSATLLPDGKVLAVGGNHNSVDAPTIVALFSAEIYDPATGTWTATSRSLNAARSTHTATLLPSGQVLIAAGFYVNNNVQLSSAELYDSAAGPITLIHPKRLPGGALQFAFTGVPNGTNTMLTTTDLALPLSNWMELGVVPEFAPGLFLFTDPQAKNHSQRVYRVRSR
jgi:WD40 repeat protein